MEGSRLAELAARHGLDVVGVTDASPLPDARVHIEASVAAGRMATMGWMGGERAERATDPRAHDATARSVVVRGRSIRGERPRGLGSRPRGAAEGAGARAGQGGGGPDRTDRAIRHGDRLPPLAARPSRGPGGGPARGRGRRPGEVAYVDDRPLAERALAERAGLGWIGKNTNLLTHHRAGSWVFLGALLTSAELPSTSPVRSSCGSCTRCLAGCPTGAIVAPQTIDARRCISYLTIEHPGVLGEWEAAAIGDWIFGCDVCQEVCPVNGDADDPGPLLVPLLPLIEWLLPMGGRAFGRALGATALTRAGRHRLLRNALAALANSGDGGTATRSLLERAAADARSEVADQARRTLERLA